jgi:hypothetical protein
MNQTWWYTPGITTLRKQRLEGCHEFQVNLGHLVRPHLRQEKNLHSLMASVVPCVLTLRSTGPWFSRSYKSEWISELNLEMTTSLMLPACRPTSPHLNTIFESVPRAGCEEHPVCKQQPPAALTFPFLSGGCQVLPFKHVPLVTTPALSQPVL